MKECTASNSIYRASGSEKEASLVKNRVSHVTEMFNKIHTWINCAPWIISWLTANPKCDKSITGSSSDMSRDKLDRACAELRWILWMCFVPTYFGRRCIRFWIPSDTLWYAYGQSSQGCSLAPSRIQLIDWISARPRRRPVAVVGMARPGTYCVGEQFRNRLSHSFIFFWSTFSSLEPMCGAWFTRISDHEMRLRHTPDWSGGGARGN